MANGLTLDLCGRSSFVYGLGNMPLAVKHSWLCLQFMLLTVFGFELCTYLTYFFFFIICRVNGQYMNDMSGDSRHMY